MYNVLIAIFGTVLGYLLSSALYVESDQEVRNQDITTQSADRGVAFD